MRPLKNIRRGRCIRCFFDLQVCTTFMGVRRVLKQRVNNSGRVVDIGCGAQPYRDLFENDYDYTGLDIDTAAADFDYEINDVIYYDGRNFPFKDEEFDLVFHSEVLEHVDDYKQFLSECNRILSHGGKMIFTIPFQARYHYVPFDYWRFTPSGIKKILVDSSFTKVFIAPRGTDITVAAYKVLSIGYRYFFSRNIFKMLLSVLLSPVWVVCLMIGHISSLLKIGSDDDCLGFVIYAMKE